MFEFWRMPEAVILEAVDADRDLRSRGAKDWQIWEKLDNWLDVDEIPLPDGTSVVDYLKSRMEFIDPDLTVLQDRILTGHVDMCLRWLDRTKPVDGESWPPSEWLTKRLPDSEFEALESGAEPSYAEARAVLHLGRSARDLQRLKLRKLAKDEIWSFSSPAHTWSMLAGRAGVALVRDGRVVAHVVTVMN